MLTIKCKYAILSSNTIIVIKITKMHSVIKSPTKPSRSSSSGLQSPCSPPRSTTAGAAKVGTPTTPPRALLLSAAGAAAAAGSPNRKRASPGGSATTVLGAMSASTATAQTRYLQEITRSFANGADMWHLMTTVPFEFEDRCNDLGALLAQHKTMIHAYMQGNIDNFGAEAKKAVLVDDKKAYGVKKARIVADFKIIQEYITQDDLLRKKIYDCLFATNGVYYLVSARGDIQTCYAFTPHSAHGLIFERRKGSFKTHSSGRPVEHDQKAASTSVMLGRTVEIINILAKYTKELSTLLTLTEQLESFAQYLDLHKRCLDHAIDYDPAAPKPAVSCVGQLEVSEFLLRWHPYPVKQITPLRPEPAVILFNQDHMQRRAKTARLLGPSTTPASSSAAATSAAILATPGLSSSFSGLLTSHANTAPAASANSSSSSTSAAPVARNLFGP